jgi:hypothetical protein
VEPGWHATVETRQSGDKKGMQDAYYYPPEKFVPATGQPRSRYRSRVEVAKALGLFEEEAAAPDQPRISMPQRRQSEELLLAWKGKGERTLFRPSCTPWRFIGAPDPQAGDPQLGPISPGGPEQSAGTGAASGGIQPQQQPAKDAADVHKACCGETGICMDAVPSSGLAASSRVAQMPK